MEQHLWNQLQVAESTYHWPQVPKPTPIEWRLWQQVIQQATSIGQTLMLPLPLGKWYPWQENSPGWYYQAQENALYHQTEDGYTQHGMYPRWSRTQAFHRAGEATTEPPAWSKLQIASVAPQGEKIVLTGIGTSDHNQQMTQLTWINKLEQTPLGTEWQLSVSYQGSMKKFDKQ